MRPGITENAWHDELNEDKRQAWGLVVVIISAIAGFFVTQTPYAVINWLIKLYVVINAYLLVQTQRKYSRLKRSSQRAYARASYLCTVTGVSFLVGGMFVVATATVIAPVAKISITQALNSSGQPLALRLIGPLVVVAACIAAVARSFKELSVKEIVVDLPRKTFVRLVYRRTYTARTVWEFAFVELAVVVYSCFFASTAADLTNLICEIFKSL